MAATRTDFRFLVVSLLFLAGCSSGFKKRWDNFTTYYNTYYNARTLVEKNERIIASQKLTVNAERPLRIWEPPNKLGSADFEKVVLKGAAILRDHPNSKWTDDALLLIGKAYFYQAQFFSAEQKFDEALLSSADPAIRQQAVFWKGRIFLESKRLREGIEYLKIRLEESEFAWTSEWAASTNALIAQMYVENEAFEAAYLRLKPVAGSLSNAAIRGKAWFLLGQLAERNKDLRAARDAYGRVTSPSLEYELRFRAKMRLAELERESGRQAVALQLFKSMAKDDKNFDVITDLNYEIGRTLQRMGRAEEAVEAFRAVLYDRQKQASGPTKAKTYYALGDLSRYNARDFSSAAVWYDSAARASPDLTKLPVGFDAAELARSFGEYRRLSTEIAASDSLLRLGMLPPAAFDSVIEGIRKARLAAFEAELKKKQKEANTATVISAPQGGNQSETGQNGFLNYRNPQLVAEASNQFKAIWGNRPLIDNWRLMEAVRQASATQTTAGGVASPEIKQQDETLKLIQIDLKPIPFTKGAQDSMRSRQSVLFYELGNLFYLNLGIPDSAESYYRKIVDSEIASPVRPGALYVLAELLSDRGRETEAREYATRLLTRFPEHELADKAAARFSLFQSEGLTVDSTAGRAPLHELLNKLEHDGPEMHDAEIRSVALQEPNPAAGAELYWMLASSYIEKGRNSTEFKLVSAKKSSLEVETGKKRSVLKATQDSIKTVLAGPAGSYTTNDSTRLISILEMEIPPIPKDTLFMYYGAAWDSARTVLNLITARHPQTSRAAIVQKILQEIRPPEIPMIPFDQLDLKISAKTSLPELLKKEGGDLSKALLNKKWSATLLINEKGLVDSVTITAQDLEASQQELLKEFINKYLKFPVPLKNGRPVKTNFTIDSGG